ncbi:MAG: D-alanyl-D-alanine carboxypeptidase/D-alanyl-D-alanine-endopeptidase [Bdellovibrionaceae bacterium]|nr:D-alanyl-D-alanine carboxypeptidase/D-alanyl-D-alanine-endopeptidase [Pseudobdellovibrionaceae bacterium]
MHRWQHHGSSSLPIRTTLILFFLFSTIIARAEFINLPNPGFYWSKNSLNQKIKKFIKKNKINPAQLSFSIKAHNPIKGFKLSHNGNTYFVPASLNKIVIALAAVEEWGIKKKFTSSLLVKKQSKIKNKQLNGSLYFNGGGDPVFVSESMWNLVRVFSHSNISVIKGDLVIFKKSFKSKIQNANKPPKGDRAYEALIAPSSFNWNSVTVKVRASTIGKKANIIIDPYKSPFLEIRNNVQSVAGSKANIQIKRLVEKKKNILIIKGKIGIKAKAFVAYKSIINPERWLGSYLRVFLKKRGIVVKGKVKIKNFNTIDLWEYKKLAEIKSKPLPLIIADMLKFSNNYIADMLSSQFYNYNLRIKDIFQKIGKPKQSAYFFNPSGLSRKNQLKANTILSLLKYIKNHTYAPELLSAFSIAGIDGTLKSYNFSQSNQVIRGKTGLLNSVVTFAGFVQAGKKEQLLVVWMFNGKAKDTLKALNWRRKFLQLLVTK